MNYEKELNFFINTINKSRINTTIINETDIPQKIDMGIRDFLNLKKDYSELFVTSSQVKNEIKKITDPFFCNYIFIPIPDTPHSSVLIVGPYTKNFITKEEIESKGAEFAFSHHTQNQIKNYFSTVPYLQDDSMLMTLVISLGETLFGSMDNFTLTTHSISELSDTSFFTKPDIDNKTDDPWMMVQLLERRYNAENTLLDAVSQGLLYKADMVYANVKPSQALESRIADPLRNAKNFMIILNTLLRKAAERGNVHPLYIDSVSSDFAKIIEELQSLDDADELFYYMIKKYCRLVSTHSQKNYSLLIQKAITRIDADITAELSLTSLAEMLNVNSSYLSSLFKKETGLTLTQYINKGRIEKAKHLLNTTNMQIQSIAQTCGILDVNYFTKIFKKYTGKTPNEFRNKKQGTAH